MNTEQKEDIKLKGEELLKKVKEIINAGNVRKITIKNKDGHTVLALPLTISAIGVVLAPMLTAVSAVAALLTECQITIERDIDIDQ